MSQFMYLVLDTGCADQDDLCPVTILLLRGGRRVETKTVFCGMRWVGYHEHRDGEPFKGEVSTGAETDRSKQENLSVKSACDLDSNPVLKNKSIEI
jgi:hypothetical protein